MADSGLSVLRKTFSAFLLAATISARRCCSRMLQVESLQGLCEQ